MPPDVIKANLDAIRETIRAKAKSDPWDALKLIHLLSYFEFHEESAQMAQEIASAQPQTKKYETLIREATIMSVLSKAEALVSEGNVGEAIQLLKEAAPLEAQREAEQKAHNARNVIDALKVADKIASRIK